MAKRGRKPKQEFLIPDIHPENSQEILETAEAYQEIVRQRCELTAEETKYKTKMKELIRGAGLQPLADGSIRFKIDGKIILSIPQDEKIQIKDDKTAD